jgi:hypothetical protein
MIMSVVLCEFCGIFGLKSGTKGKPAPMFWSRLGWGETEEPFLLSVCPRAFAVRPLREELFYLLFLDMPRF